MAQPPTPNMGLVLPTEGGDSGTWDEELDVALTLVEGHDHSNGKGVRVTPAGLNISSDLTFAGHGALNLGAAQFTPIAAAAMAGRNRGLWVNTLDNELYFRNNTGTDIQVTTGTTLNISTVGAIGGDYTTVGALFSYDDATDRYLAQQQGSPRPWAGIALGNLDIFQEAAGIVNRVRVKSPAALAASYDLTLPTALPGSSQLLQVDNAGQISASNIVAQALTASSTLHVVGAVTFDASLSVGTTLGVTGAATLTGGIANAVTLTLGAVVAANQNLTLSGTGYIKTGIRKRSGVFEPNLAQAAAGVVTHAYPTPYPSVDVSADVRWPLGHHNQGERLQTLIVHGGSSGGGTKTYTLEVMDIGGGLTAVPGATLSTVVNSNPVTLTPTTPALLGDGESYFLRVTTDAAAAITPKAWVKTYDVP